MLIERREHSHQRKGKTSVAEVAGERTNQRY